MGMHAKSVLAMVLQMKWNGHAGLRLPVLLHLGSRSRLEFEKQGTTKSKSGSLSSRIIPARSSARLSCIQLVQARPHFFVRCRKTVFHEQQEQGIPRLAGWV